MTRRLALDTNLLVLLVVGQVSPQYIGRHKRLRAFSVSDFILLNKVLSGFGCVVVTPSALSEVSNLVGYGIVDPMRSQLMTMLATVISNAIEDYNASQDVSRAKEFLRLGLADMAWLATLDDSTTLLTDDLDLYLAALSRGAQAFNFSHLRESEEGQ